MTEPKSGQSGWFRNPRQGRVILLLGLLGLMAAVYVFLEFGQKPGQPGAEPKSDPEYEAQITPSLESLLGYLDGKDVLPTDAQGIPMAGAAPLTLKKEAIEGLKIRREDHYFILANFKYPTEQGKYAIQIMINHSPSDGSYAYQGLKVHQAIKE